MNSRKPNCFNYERYEQLKAKAEKYRWHDLKENPDDLPKESGEYLTHDQACLDAGFIIPEVLIFTTQEDYDRMVEEAGAALPAGWRSNTDRFYPCEIIHNIRAWKEIEPFDCAELHVNDVEGWVSE